MPLHFLVDDASQDVVVLTGAEAHHAAAVRRIRTGETVTVGDGRGTWLEGVCDEVSPREVTVRVSSRAVIPRQSPRLVLVQALAKGDRDELAIQAATELGVDEIVPWQASRSVSRWDAAKAVKGRARWQAIAREAAKQAHRAWIPLVTEPVATAALAARAAQSRMIVLEPAAATRMSQLDLTGDDDVVLVVGPEGGVAADEADALVRAGATAARLGDTVLRTSTAGPAALAVALARLGRW